MEQPNLHYIDELSGDDLTFRNRFITIIKEEFPQESDAYLRHLANQSMKQSAEIVHKLKHKFNILGMEESYKLAVVHEMELLDGDMGSSQKFEDILSTIDAYLKTI